MKCAVGYTNLGFRANPACVGLNFIHDVKQLNPGMIIKGLNLNRKLREQSKMAWTGIVLVNVIKTESPRSKNRDLCVLLMSLAFMRGSIIISPSLFMSVR